MLLVYTLLTTRLFELVTLLPKFCDNLQTEIYLQTHIISHGYYLSDVTSICA